MKKAQISLKVMTLFVFAVLTLAGTAAFAAEPDADVGGLWLRAPAFPAADEEGRVEVLEFTDDREMDITTYIRSLDSGSVIFEIRRQSIEGSELQSPDDVEGLIEMRVGNDEIPKNVLEENMGSIEVDTDAGGMAKLITYPCATAEFVTGANEDTRMNAAMFVFTDAYSFEVLASIHADSFQEYESDVQDWFESAQLVERDPYPAGGDNGDSGADDAADARIEGLWLEFPGLEPMETEVATDESGAVVYAAAIADGLTMTILRNPNPGNILGTDQAAKFVAGLVDISEDEVDVTVPEEGEKPFPAAGKYPFAMAEFATGEEGAETVNLGLFFFPEDLIFFVRLEAASEEIIEEHQEDILKWFNGLTFVEQ